jgi:uncharacterized protein
VARKYRERSWINPDVEVRASTIEGNGLFAKRPFPTGEAVLVLGGIVIDDRELAKLRPRSSLAVGEGLNLMQADDDPAQYGNHSCDPNCWMADQVTVVARRPISADEEITQDYSLMTVAPEWEMVCRCGTHLCRGLVSGGDWQLPELQARYRGHFSPFIDRRIERDRAR